MIRSGPLTLVLLCLGAIAALPARGAGPTTPSNSDPPLPVIWRDAMGNPSSAVPYNLDRGGLGLLTEAQTDGLVRELFQVWTDVPTSSIAFAEGAKVNVDITSANIGNFLNVNNDGINPIIYDQDGSIHDAIFGMNNSVLGFAGYAGFFTGTVAAVVEGQAALNGRFLDGNAANGEISVEVFRGVFVHEFGHYFGLEHAQFARMEAFDGTNGNENGVATMFPVNIHGGTSLEGSSLHLDDVVSVSTLYPAPSFATSFGRITGTVFDSAGVSLQGVNVIARKLNDPLITVTNFVSGRYFQERSGGVPSASQGTTNTAFRGVFEIFVPPGEYTLEIESIDTRFTGGSLVGPIDPPAFLTPFEYWNGFNESSNVAVDDPMEQVPISIDAGETIAGIQFFVNQSRGVLEQFTGGNPQDIANTQLIFEPDNMAPGGYRVRRIGGINAFQFDPAGHTNAGFGDDSAGTLLLPSPIVLPFHGIPYTSVNISSNGFLSFGPVSAAEDTDFTETIQEFMSPRPRLAMFWTDLVPTATNVKFAAFIGGGSSGLIVTYDNVALSTAGTVSFQVVFETNGRITITYLAMAAGATGIVGVSSGGTFNAAGVVTKDYGALANDSTAPDVAFTSPADRSTVSGTVALAVNANDAGSGVEKVDFYVESNRIGTDMTAPFEANWDSTTSTNNPHRVLAVATDRNGNVRSAGITLTPNNASRPRISQFVSATVVNGSIVTMTFNIRNDGPGDVTNVTLQQFWAEGTGAGIVGIRRLNASPTDGTVLPRNFGALMPGQTATVDLRFFVPVGVDQFRRWVSHGTVVSGGATINL